MTNSLLTLEGLEEERHLLEIDKCRADPVYFISNYLYIYEEWDKFDKGFKKFKLWPKQKECVRFIELAYKEQWQEIVIEKCRRMGVSLLVSGLGLYHWLFDPDFSMLMGTLNENKIKLIPGHDTLFAKLRDYLEHLPQWMLPKGFDLTRHLTSMNLFNPESGNTIKGELLTTNFGRGPRSSWCFRDEAAFPLEDTSENTVSTAQLNIDGSTVNGLNYFHYNGLAAAQYSPSRFFAFDWWDNPAFTKKYMQEEEQRARQKGAESYAKFRREMLRDKRANVEGMIYPNIEKCQRGKFEYNPDWPLFCIWDYGWTDMGYVGFIQRNPDTGDLYLIDEVYNSHVSIEWYVPFIPRKVVTSSPYRYLPEHQAKIHSHREWTGPVFHYGDPTGNQKTAGTGLSVFDILKPYSIRPRCKSGWNNMGLRQEKASEMLTRLSIDDGCQYFYDSFTQFVVPKRADNSQATTPQTKGVHQWSHAPSAFEAFAISEPPLDYDQPQDLSALMKENKYMVIR